MKKFLIILILLGVIGGGVYYYDPGLLGLDSPQKISKKTKKKKKAAKKAKVEKQAAPVAELAETEATPPEAPADEPEPEEEDDEESAAAVAPASQPLAFLDNKEARAKAKAEGRPSLILWYGSDWLPQAGTIVKEWNKLEKKNLPVVLGQIDERVGAIPTLDERKNLLPAGEFHDLPIAVLLAPDETLLDIYTGKKVLKAAAMEKAVKSSLERMPKFMELVKKAEDTEGVEGAKAAADALAMQSYEVACRNRKLQNILNKKDPEHETLCRYLYCMDHIGMYGEINAVLRGGKGADAQFNGAERKFDEGIAFVQKVLKARKINTWLQQQWTSGLAYVYREKYRATKEPALRQKMVDTYRKVVKMDPDSQYGKGAARWADYWDESTPYVFEEPYYDSGDMTTDFEKEWRVNVSKQMDGPGTYSFTLEPYKTGRMTSKGFQLFANGKHVCDAEEPADKDTKSVTFNVPRALKGKVEVRFKAQCFDGWFGCGGVMHMQKK